MSTQPTPPSSIRFPEPLRDRVLAVAEVERRTFSNQIVVLVEEALSSRSKPKEKS